MHYAHHRGRTVGRLLHCIEVYTDSFFIDNEDVRIGNNQISYARGVLGQVKSWDGDIPDLEFSDGPFCDRLIKAQYVKKPFLDDYTVLLSIDYIIRRVIESISFDEALYAMWVRDSHGGDFEKVNFNRPDFPNKIRHIISKSCQFNLSNQRLDTIWRHILFSAIYDRTRKIC